MPALVPQATDFPAWYQDEIGQQTRCSDAAGGERDQEDENRQAHAS